MLWALAGAWLATLVANAARWLLDPAAPDTDCFGGTGGAAETVCCLGLDVVLVPLFWMLWMGPLALVVAPVVQKRRRDR